MVTIELLGREVMAKTEWYRRTTWTAADRDDFESRLNRSRSAFHKSQYLRIQALHLAEAGQYQEAIELLDRMLLEFPDKSQLTSAHSQKARALAKLGQTEAAIEEYRTALQSERDFPNVRTTAWLDFGWLVIERELTGLYNEVGSVLNEFRQYDSLLFPVTAYRYAAVQAILADSRGERAAAREFAKMALIESDKQHSGLRYHPAIGLVGPERTKFERRLLELAGI